MYVRLQKTDFEAAYSKGGCEANAINVKLCDSVTDKERFYQWFGLVQSFHALFGYCQC